MFTVPTELLPLRIPFTDQVTDVFALPLTVAVNGCEPPTATLADVGEMVTLTVPPPVPVTCTVNGAEEPAFGAGLVTTIDIVPT